MSSQSKIPAQFQETTRRSLFKAVSWRVWATLATILIAFLITGQAEVALAIGGIEVVAKFLLYFLHERVWNSIDFGRFRFGQPQEMKLDRPFVLWFTGLPSSGKSTLAEAFAGYLKSIDVGIEHLDGDVVRAVFPATGFSADARNNHVRQMGFLAGLIERQGSCVVASFVSPYRESRQFARETCRSFIEIHVAASLEECERRDVKGLYQKARAGEITNFTGIDDPYEVPLSPELALDTGELSVEQCVEEIRSYLQQNGFLLQPKKQPLGKEKVDEENKGLANESSLSSGKHQYSHSS